jgi:hypothetical protein
LALSNTLAFNVTELITAVKSFMIQTPAQIMILEVCTSFLNTNRYDKSYYYTLLILHNESLVNVCHFQLSIVFADRQQAKLDIADCAKHSNTLSMSLPIREMAAPTFGIIM